MHDSAHGPALGVTVEPEDRFQLIETLRWEPAGGFLRLDRHLPRLQESAAALGFACDPAVIGAALGEAIANASAALRVRLMLSPDGTPTVSTQPYEPLPPGKIWTLRIASTRLDSRDQLLRHKTTRRQVYDAARAEYPRDAADEVLLLNERGEICEGTITNIFADLGDGILLTPPLECGLLTGVLRAELLETGRAREAALTPESLRDAGTLFVGNSLRGLIAARLA